MTRAKRTHPGDKPSSTQAPATVESDHAAQESHTDGDGAEVRRSLIAAAAYYRAERRGFVDGQADDDWFAAEAEVDLLLNARGNDTPS